MVATKVGRSHYLSSHCICLADAGDCLRSRITNKIEGKMVPSSRIRLMYIQRAIDTMKAKWGWPPSSLASNTPTQNPATWLSSHAYCVRQKPLWKSTVMGLPFPNSGFRLIESPERVTITPLAMPMPMNFLNSSNVVSMNEHQSGYRTSSAYGTPGVTPRIRPRTTASNFRDALVI